MSELVGRKLGKYTLESQLGEGGMAAVFKSRHPQLDRAVAIKVLPPSIAQDPGFRARFEREGRTIASLNHPNIIRIYDVDEADGLFYMVMDLLPGGTIESYIHEEGLDRKWSTDVVVKVAEALDYAHARGIIHRDIKPSNILLDAENQPVLADFGIARVALAAGEPTLTAAGMIMGTPAYMAPEQLTGGQPDARSDIYALGVVLYQLLTGRAPFTGDTMAIVTAHLTKEPPHPREIVADLPPALDAVVLQALAKQPEHRFRSAGVFAKAIRSAADDLEPGLVRIVSAAREVAAPTFNAVIAPGAVTSTTQVPAAPPQAETTGQKVARLLPTVLGALGLLMVLSFVIRRWALFTLLAILLGGGTMLFLYLRATAQGRRSARETTRAITTASIHAAAPAAPPAEPHADQAGATTQPVAGTRATGVLDEHDDTPQAALPPTEAVPMPIGADLPPSEAIPAPADTQADPVGSQQPTQSLPLAQSHEDLPMKT